MGPFLLGTIHILLATQATPATIAGAVRNEATGEPLAGAVVALTDLGRATIADAGGRYQLRDVPTGPQHLTVRFIGYTQRTLHALVPPQGALEINVSLRPDPVRLQTIEVRPLTLVRGVDDGGAGFPDRGSSIAAVRNHPLLAEPDVLQALAGGEVALSAESPSGLHVRGGASDQTAYLLDGIPVLSPYHAAGTFSAWNPDAIAGLQLSSTTPPPESPHALSGVVSAVTRAPDGRTGVQGSVSTTQARITVDGPIGAAGAGYLLSVRSGFPGIIAPEEDASYLHGDIGDRLAKLELPALGGQAKLLAYHSYNEIDAAAAVEADDESSPSAGRNVFEWHSRSVGAEWTRAFPSGTVRLLGWHATSDAGSTWAAEPGWIDLSAARRDAGVLATVARTSTRATTLAGIRVERSRTSYRVHPETNEDPSLTLRAETPVTALLARHARRLTRWAALDLGAALAVAQGEWYLQPRAQLRWTPSDALTLSGSYARLRQFAQSLRNAESVVGAVFPVDLYLGAAAPGVPVARSDQGVIAADYRPSPGVRISAQVYERNFDGLLLVAPREGEPFATGAFAVGRGGARGGAIDATVSTARFGLIASYGVQRVRFATVDASYVPHHGATHLVEGGVILFPTATSSIRLGASGALGRRTTTATGSLEWEACTLRDQGCEFGGSPRYGDDPLGSTTLPPYLRLDLGVRKHWHFTIGRRDASVALFGTLTNVLSRQNVLTYVKDPSTGTPAAVEMRPLAPLVVGLDWRF